MAIALSASNWHNYWQQECISVVNCVGRTEEIWQEKGLLGESVEKYIPLCHGLFLEISDAQMYENVVYYSEYKEQNYLDNIVINFVVSGNVKTIHHGVTDYVWETPGKNYIEFWDSRQETEYWTKCDRILKLRVGIEVDTLRTMSQDCLDTLPMELKHLVEGKKMLPCYRQGNNTMAMNHALSQIIKCPYQGCTRNFYLESKALELVSLWLAENTNNIDADVNLSLKKKDIEALNYAKEIINKNLQNPPSLQELSHQICLNEFKLKSGFKQLFGTTVFGYLHQQRMEYAQHLLKQNNLKVTDIAHLCGYSSLPSFSKAFKKYFGISPKGDRIL